MRELPILMSAPMVRATLDGRKTQTRRVLKVQPWEIVASIEIAADRTYYEISRGGSKCHILSSKCRYAVGDRLWVKETHYMFGKWVRNGYTAKGKIRWRFKPIGQQVKYTDEPPVTVFTKKTDGEGWYKRPSIFMCRWASRITLEVTGVRVQRLQEISEEDAKAEGVEAIIEQSGVPASYVSGFYAIWQSINSKTHPWESNPWVWGVEFRRIEG